MAPASPAPAAERRLPAPQLPALSHVAPAPGRAERAEQTFTGAAGAGRWESEVEDFPTYRQASAPSGPRRARRRHAAFHWSERDWSDSAWQHRARLLPGLVALLAILLIAGAFAFVLVSKAASGVRGAVPSTQSTNTPGNSILIQQPPVSASPTPPQQPYDIGVWLSSLSPGGGSVTAFVRVSHLTAPVANVPVTLTLQGASIQGGGPRLTTADGVATFTVVFGGASTNQPIFVFASATVQGNALSAQTTFFPGGGGGSVGEGPPQGFPRR
ncbi:MAG TPA: hypothetical protein VKC57_08880 [Ktedonobacterales bacterium]|nr:hypothetical protein [Ktedonobacterales bacterium]